MKNLFITEVKQAMLNFLDNAQIAKLDEVLNHFLYNKEIIEQDNTNIQQEMKSNEELLAMFLSAKKVEGCSTKTFKNIIKLQY